MEQFTFSAVSPLPCVGFSKNLYPTVILINLLVKLKFSPNPNRFVRCALKTARLLNGKGKGHPCTGTEALYRPYGP